MDRTVTYLIREEFDSALDFFQEFGDYWEERGWQKIGHQLEDLFARLHAFLLQRGIRRPEVALGLMKLDYFLGHKYKPRKIWWDFTLAKDEQAELMRRAAERPHDVSPQFAELGLGEKELHKHAVVEVLPFDLAAYEAGADACGDGEATLLIVYYPPDVAAPASYYGMKLDSRPAAAK
jgi:hypothetical protein